MQEYSRGIVMNKSTGKTISEVEDFKVEGTGFECFGDNHINLGGDLPHQGFVILHPHNVHGAREV